ncbi:MAG: hypothetical protein OHM56_06235 [Spiroplasma phoeniceum]|nr:MAG: hypothetical protein OHM57_05645 [Spiroplasma phoeniceum]UZQ33508.1 MAG: hypothetical protein OHM56_06235 [Spiroplasma phoeniceum]
MTQTKSNLHKKLITNKPKIKNKRVNKLELYNVSFNWEYEIKTFLGYY